MKLDIIQVGRQILAGAVAGSVATVPMTVVMSGIEVFLADGALQRLPPVKVSARISTRLGWWQQMTTIQRAVLSICAHFAYGATMGAVFAPVVHISHLPIRSAGCMYGLLIWASSYRGWLPALGIMSNAEQQRPGHTAQLVVSHLVWGAALGYLLHAYAHRLPQRSFL